MASKILIVHDNPQTARHQRIFGAVRSSLEAPRPFNKGPGDLTVLNCQRRMKTLRATLAQEDDGQRTTAVAAYSKGEVRQ